MLKVETFLLIGFYPNRELQITFVLEKSQDRCTARTRNQDFFIFSLKKNNLVKTKIKTTRIIIPQFTANYASFLLPFRGLGGLKIKS